ncbi:hypothetical protein PBI_KAMPE_73 [Gordonia phage Kampe]|uniref:Uncharacterized protein n=3 Tax=Gordonia phage Orchid TaxID=1838075 RepID=A0A160DJK7_9CAUD|nr:hypothetical protein BH761_gp072 [Gordonia phage Orchid]ANA87307.1 hypothetical protein PBI_PATRICKSTAR_73 [Gordonia phage PatrickStar]ANA87419.1 hypothetical protein PBI_ORCHID_72 [Gordonia phage Orchid]ANA87534.1 hypothetical protein PBI_KAMPE_73 [Gordonia phage Kampe]AXH46522.1 hypothetical protein SEA_ROBINSPARKLES_74 [Gordonia phage RobinSparkles]
MFELFESKPESKPSKSRKKTKPPAPSKKVIPKSASELELESAVQVFKDQGMVDD